MVGGGSDPHEVFRSFDKTACGLLSPADIVKALARIGLKASLGFVAAVVRCEDTSETNNQAATELVSQRVGVVFFVCLFRLELSKLVTSGIASDTSVFFLYFVVFMVIR